ncbi:hypothetical protein K435DRAFT_807897 [Dendrothele bispora CBS 962.96]|uniref:DUF6534 domain-containing protein n=1 Tax=Dendrothele bispora (strain CBS 962.96) TaxID=1314807 RepID=A0A4S8L356_DENBC|nr:hypothetical protein K435DRAFT_807897 [Dendrothele bispora CBS 962.96]
MYAVRPLEAQNSSIVPILSIVSLVSSGITDIFLAVALVMLLKPMVKDSFREDTKQKVNQVLHRAVSTGTLTAVLKIVMLTLAVSSSNSQSNVFLVPHSVYFNGRPFESLSPQHSQRIRQPHENENTYPSVVLD